MNLTTAPFDFAATRAPELLGAVRALRDLLEALDDEHGFLVLDEPTFDAVGRARVALARLDEREGT